jgi:hypothetical protein
VEVVDPIPVDGEWTVEVHAHELRGGSSQKFALVVSGMRAVTNE